METREAASTKLKFAENSGLRCCNAAGVGSDSREETKGTSPMRGSLRKMRIGSLLALHAQIVTANRNTVRSETWLAKQPLLAQVAVLSR